MMRFGNRIRRLRGRFTGVWHDLRFACRGLARRPLFALVAVGTLSVGIAASTTFFSLVDAVILRPLRVPDADRLVGVQTTTASGDLSAVVSLPDYEDYRDASEGTLELAAHHLSDISLGSDGGSAARVALAFDVSGNYFRALRVRPALGRFFAGEDVDRPDAPAEVVLSHALWRNRYGRDPGVIGRTLHVNGRPLSIVGVAPEGFHGTMLGARPAAWLPLGLHGRLTGRDIASRDRSQWLQLFGRLEPGVSPERAASGLTVTARRLGSEYEYHEEVEPRGVVVRAFSALPPGLRDMAGRFTLLLLAAASVLLLIAAVNVAGMLLARSSRRGREMAVRRALGAGRGRIARQLLAEGLVLGLVAGALGVGLSIASLPLIAGVAPPGAPGFRLDLALDGPVLAFAVASALAASLLFGLVPARYATRSDLVGSIRRGVGSRSRTRGRSLLVAGQVALTLVLLVSTALLFRTLRNVLATDHGFDPEGVVLAEVNLRLNGYDQARGRTFQETLLERLRASPEIASAALSTSIPLGGGWDQTRARVPGVESPSSDGFPVGWSAVSEGYFETLGLPLLAGTPPPDETTPLRLVVNEALATRFWPGASAVGRRFRFGGREAEVAGVAPTGKYRSLSEEPRLFAWRPLGYSPHVYVHVRPRGATATAVRELRTAVASLDPHLPLIGVRTLEAAMGQSFFFQRIAAGLIGIFAALGLLLSATGIFGLLAYTVEQRRREIGIRMAIGAEAADVVRAVVGRGLRPVVLGLGLGLLGAWAATRVLEGMLYRVQPLDPASFAAGAAVLLGAAALAAWLPGRRAAKVDPARTLDAE